jgi:hypothetical protein
LLGRNEVKSKLGLCGLWIAQLYGIKDFFLDLEKLFEYFKPLLFARYWMVESSPQW